MTQVRATFGIKSWDEKPVVEPGDGTKVTRAHVGKTYQGDITGEAMMEGAMYYRADGTAAFNGFERIDGAIGGRKGSFVLQYHGTYENGTATSHCTVVTGSGTGELKGLSGKGRYDATHTNSAAVPFTLDHSFG